ncbi:MAG: acyl-CoA dehydrogenase family protein, partial [Burkholderiales bacterium]|nr:acyl-CoA dehydrogenase family protein [Burkholderiales bacterium]
MDFDFTDEQESLRDAVRRWVERGFTFQRRHELAKAGGATRPVWAELGDLGLTGLVVAEDQGGMGFGAVEAMVVNEELGRGLVNAPYAAGALVAPSLLGAAPQALQAAWLPKIADASALVVLAHQERAARYRLNHVQTRAEHKGSGWTLSGAKSLVPAGDEADAFIVPARISGGVDDAAGVGLFLVERGAATLRGYPTQDGARAAEVGLDKAAAALLAEDGLPLLERAADIALAAQAAEAVGLMDR